MFVRRLFSSNSHLGSFSYDTVRVTNGSVLADILVDCRAPSDIWMYVVQRQGSPDIMAMGSCNSEPETRTAANQAVRQYDSRQKNATA